MRNLTQISLLIALVCSLSLSVSCSDENEGTNNGSNNGITPNNGTNNGTNNGNNPDMGPDMTPPDPAEFGLDTRPSNTTCAAPERPTPASDFSVDRVFPNLSFNSPLSFQQAPGDTSRWFVIEQRGRVKTFANQNDTDTSTDFIDISGDVACCGERGLLGLAFHPDWPNTPKAYLSYTNEDSGLVSRISEFTTNDSGATLDASTERILLSVDQPYGNHNGGMIDFGPDGFLYISLGDGGSGGDPQGYGQNQDSMLGAILRIDVDSGDPYGIPSDNPFAQGGGAAEIYAWGLRNVWRFSFDTATGNLWAGDVGQNAWEEVDLIQLGGNYGWNEKEGFACFGGGPCDNGPWIDPIVVYDHSNNNRSITGGYVYHGASIPAFDGTYVFGDYVSGRIWAIVYDTAGEATSQELLQTGFNISSFGQGADGEIYVINYGSGTIHQLVAVDPGPDNFPKTLSATGCVDANNPKEMAEGVIPFEPNAPFWSDGAIKTRWMAVPDGEMVTIGADGRFVYPTGSVLIKSFELGGKLIETRLFVLHDDGEWGGYVYEWRDDESDADLLTSGKVKDVNGQSWIYPSRSECLSCHTANAGRVLGPEIQQLNGDMVYTETNRISNQVATLAHIGILDSSYEDPSNEPALEDPFGTGPMAERAEAYLHTNCGGCHRPGSGMRIDLDFRYGVAMEDRGICDVDPVGGDLDVTDSKILFPASATDSIMYLRANRRDAQGMPPLGSTVVDQAGVDLMAEWINSIATCP